MDEAAGAGVEVDAEVDAEADAEVDAETGTEVGTGMGASVDTGSAVPTPSELLLSPSHLSTFLGIVSFIGHGKSLRTSG